MTKITRKQLIRKFIEFYKSKSHKEISNSSLIPENNPTVLFTTAGMHPLLPYLLGQEHPQGKKLCNVQKCIRTVDIEEVGDNCHHTFFEMLGKWSLDDYWKEDAIKYTFEFYTKVLKIPIERLAVSCFKGDKRARKDKETERIWISLKIPREKIVFLDKKENWWETPGPGPCGPDTENFFWFPNNISIPKEFNVDDKRWVEIGNDVLMQYEKDKNGNYKEAKQKNIDYGGGMERMLAVFNGFEDNYLTEIWQPIIKQIEELSGKRYIGNKKAMRIIADHIKAAVMILADGITPSNTEQGYVLRRLIRRAIRYGQELNLKDFTSKVAEPVFKIYDDYKHLQKNKTKILEELEKEENRFNQTIEQGIKIFYKLSKDKKQLSGKNAFLLYQSYGFPIEMTMELGGEKNIKVDKQGFEKENKKHQKLSRTSTQGKFKSGLQDSGEKTTKLHTATHLLHAALRKILGSEVQQKGSNINSERLRFDFTFNRKLTDEEKQNVESIVNELINKKLGVTKKEMSQGKAKKLGALGFFEHKYGDVVSVYSIGNFSKEICTGPHVSNTSELGRFKILKEESSSAGVRRIKGVLE